jgi:glycosyltransferase involved in cell wall biosynthesis
LYAASGSDAIFVAVEMLPSRLLVVVNDPAFFVAQHLHLALAARQAGFDVQVAAPEGAGMEVIRAHGFPFHPVRMRRGAIRPWQEARSLHDLVRLYRVVRPDLVYHITLKAILHGTLAARLAGVPAVVNANTGLGFTFIDDTWQGRLFRAAMQVAFRGIDGHENRVDLFLNPDDRATLLRLGMTRPATSVVIRGPGVDVRQFSPAPEPPGVPVVVLAARMLWHKGVGEFVEAARLLARQGVKARFVLVGDADPGNLASIPRAQLQSWHDEQVVEWWGYQSDMPAVFRQAHLVVLPSYREGLGKVLIEAAAMARPLVATDVPGCREVCRPEVNGLLVPVQAVSPLATAMARLIASPELRQRFGQQGRQLVASAFGTDTIAAQTLAVFRHLLTPTPHRSPLSLSEHRMPSPTPARPAVSPALAP